MRWVKNQIKHIALINLSSLMRSYTSRSTIMVKLTPETVLARVITRSLGILLCLQLLQGFLPTPIWGCAWEGE